MNFSLILSLKNLTLVRIAASLWKREDASGLVPECSSAPVPATWDGKAIMQKMTEEVLKRVEELPLPGVIKAELANIVQPVVSQILLWIHFHDVRCNVRVKKIPNEFCWTARGTIDKRRTAELLIKEESLTIDERYRLACTYCLEEYMQPLWEQRKSFGNGDLKNIRILEPPLVSFWSHYFEGKVTELYSIIQNCCESDYHTPYEFGFHDSSVSGNVAATRYFLQKLTSESKDAIIVKTVGCVGLFRCFLQNESTDLLDEDYADVMCLLLSNLSEVERSAVLKSFPFEVLMCLLDWPWQDLFMSTARCVWGDLSKTEYRGLFRCIVSHKIAIGSKDHNYQEILGRFWRESPVELRKYVIDETTFGGSLLHLFKAKDYINIRVVLDDSCFSEMKKSQFFCFYGKTISFDLMNSNQWDLLEFVIKQCLHSNKKIISFKEGIKLFMMAYSGPYYAESEEWEKFSQMIDRIVDENNRKRSIKTNLPTKRFCVTVNESGDDS